MDNAFSLVARSILELQDRYERQDFAKSSPKSAIGLWRKGQEMHTFLKEWIKERNAEFEKTAARFEQGYKMQQRNEFDQKMRDAVNDVVASFRKDVDAFIEDKTNRLDSMLVTPPTESQKNLLDAVAMRGSGLTQAEAMRMLPVLIDNYVATEAFRGLCEKAGFKLYTPGENAVDLYGIIEEFRMYMNRICRQMGVKDGSMDMMAGSFFMVFDDPNYVEPAIEKFSQALDAPAQLRNNDANTLTASESAKIRTMFSGIEKYDPEKISDRLQILRIVDKVTKDYPKDIPLILKSSYGKYLEMSFNLKKSRMDAIAGKAVEDHAAPEE